MHPLIISISGDFWDCQIYMGRLYLWKMDGNLNVYRWDDIVDSIIRSTSERLALSCAFTNGAYLYHSMFSNIFADPDVKGLLRNKFINAAQQEYVFSEIDIRCHLIGTQSNPFDTLPTDTEIYNRMLYASTDSGFWVASAHKKTKHPVSSRPNRLWDCPVLSITANRYAQMALSAGSDGLFEYELSENFSRADTFQNTPTVRAIEPNIMQLSTRHSLFASYTSLSLYNSSPSAGSFLSLFKWKALEREHANNSDYIRVYDKEINENDIFHNLTEGLSWGAGNRLYRASNGVIESVDYRNITHDKDADDRIVLTPFSRTRIKHLANIKGNPLFARVAYYGSIIEDDNGLTVIMSDEHTYRIHGHITRWRIYPRSKNYENHLHVIRNDRIDILSFNHDYFADQSDKQFGMSYDQHS